MTNIFSGLRVLDLTRIFSGPFATRYFADYGAEVIKVETQIVFDEARGFTPIRNGASAYFEVLNRGKKSIELDLKNPDHYQQFLRLVESVDMVVENFRPDVKKKLKIDYETLSVINPRLIYGSISGYAPDINTGAYDVVIQAQSGLASLNGETKPMKNATAIIDCFSGQSLALGLTTALYEREKTGKGKNVHVSMIAAAFNLLEQNIALASLEGVSPSLLGNHDNSIAPFGFFACQDGTIAMAIGNEAIWKQFCDVYLPGGDQRYPDNETRTDQRIQLAQEIEQSFAKHSVASLLTFLESLKVPCAKIMAIKDVLDQQYLYDNSYLTTIDHDQLGKVTMQHGYITYSDRTIEPMRPAPSIGQHTKEILGS